MKTTLFEVRETIRRILTEGTCSKCGKTNVLTSKIGTKEVCYYGCNSPTLMQNAPAAPSPPSKNVFKLTGPTELVPADEVDSYRGREKFRGDYRYFSSLTHPLTVHISSIEEGRALGFTDEVAQSVLDDGGELSDRFIVWVAFDLYHFGRRDSESEVDGHQIVALQYMTATVALLSEEDANQLDRLVDVNDNEMVDKVLDGAREDSY